MFPCPKASTLPALSPRHGPWLGRNSNGLPLRRPCRSRNRTRSTRDTGFPPCRSAPPKCRHSKGGHQSHASRQGSRGTTHSRNSASSSPNRPSAPPRSRRSRCPGSRCRCTAWRPPWWRIWNRCPIGTCYMCPAFARTPSPHGRILFRSYIYDLLVVQR